MSEVKGSSSVEQIDDPLDPKKFEGLDLNQRFPEQRSAVITHYIEAYESLPQLSRDPDEVKRGIRELIKTKGFFTATDSERQSYENPAFAEGEEDTLNENLRRWANDTVKEVISTLQNMGKIDREKK
jgi:hypothetical protein